jgi:hypothetical protein
MNNTVDLNASAYFQCMCDEIPLFYQSTLPWLDVKEQIFVESQFSGFFYLPDQCWGDVTRPSVF